MNKATACANAAIFAALLSIRPASALEPVGAVGSGEAPRTVTEFAKIRSSAGCPVAFGASVAVSGDNVVVGAPDYITEDGVVGTAYVFHRVGPKWLEVGKVLPALGGINGEDFGLSVAIEGDYIVIGAPHVIAGFQGGHGRAFNFRRYDRGTPDDPLDDVWGEDAWLTSPDERRDGDHYGRSVSISEGAVLVGRPGDEHISGSAYLYRKENEVWRHVGSLSPSDSVLSDQFGKAVSLSGPVALVGAPQRSDDGTGSGAAYIFRESGGAWLEEAKLTASDGALGDFLGATVSIAGDYAVAGAYGDDDAGPSSGSAYAFEGAGNAWSNETKLTASDAVSNDSFGQAVAANGDMILVGAPRDDFFGAAYLFVRKCDQWVEERKLVASNRPSPDIVGASVALSERYAFTSAAGKVYVFVLPSAAKSLRDFSAFQLCFRAEDQQLSNECEALDLAPDGRIDGSDLSEFLALFAGP